MSSLEGDLVTVNGRRYVPEPTYEMTDGARRIAIERARQVVVEGWTTGHDDEHGDGAMGRAAQCYIGAADAADRYVDPTTVPPPDDWPWDAEWWKPSKLPVRNLEKAGALIAAEIDRLLRKQHDEFDKHLEAMGQ